LLTDTSSRIFSTIAVKFMRAPSTTASGGSMAMSNVCRWTPLPVSLSWVILMELEPISSPREFLPEAIATSTGAPPRGRGPER